MLTICKDSHLDHELSLDQLRWVLETFADRSGFFIETVELPVELGGLSCGLYGPLMGDESVPEGEVVYKPRGGREGASRLCPREPRRVRRVTVIAGPHEDLDCVLYTVYGGPCAPKEPTDPTLKDEEREASEAFWKEHALAYTEIGSG
jgi:hypothetical protein